MKKEIQILTGKRMAVPHDDFAFEEVQLESIMFKSRSTAWKMAVTPKSDPTWKQLAPLVAEYNGYLQELHTVPTLKHFIAENGYCVTHQQLANEYGEEVANQVFSLKSYPFRTRLEIRNGYLINTEAEPRFRTNIPGFGLFHFTVGDLSVVHSTSVHVHASLLFNWSEDYRDLCYALLTQLEGMGLRPDESDDSIKSYANYDCYEQHRENISAPDKNLLRCLEILKDMGYLTLYKIKPNCESPWFPCDESAFGTVAVLDWDYRKDSLINEKLRLVLAQPEKEVGVCRYFLTGSNGKQYLSNRPGKLGGHRELKIYGKLDCSSANRHIANGNYIRHRVFFADEDTATAAGYRPCGVCMKSEYVRWKENHS